MNRTSTVTSSSSGGVTDATAETSTWDSRVCLHHSPVPASTIPYKGISTSISDTREKFYGLLKRPLRALWSPKARHEGANRDDTGAEQEDEARPHPRNMSEGARTSPRRLSKLSVKRGASSTVSKSSDAKSTCVRKASTSATAESVQHPCQNTASDNQLADFMDLQQDPFACYTVGSPQIVKDLTSALPLAQNKVTNKVIAARRRVRRISERPVSTGKRPISAGRRPSSAGSNSGTRARFEWRVGTTTPSHRIVRLRPPTPRKPSVSKVDGTGPHVPPPPPTAPLVSINIARSGVKSQPLVPSNRPDHPTTRKTSKLVTARARPATPSKRLEKSKFSMALPYRAPRPPTPSRISRTPSVLQAARPARPPRHSFNLRHYLPFILPPASNAISSSSLPPPRAPHAPSTNSNKPALHHIPTSSPCMPRSPSATSTKRIVPMQSQNESPTATPRSRRLSHKLPSLTMPTQTFDGG